MLTLISKNTSTLPVSVAEAKDHASITIADDDALIESYIRAAALQVETYCQKTIFPASYLLTLPKFPAPDKKNRRYIWLDMPPIDAIQSVSYSNISGGTTVMAADTDYYASLSGSRPFLAPPQGGWPDWSVDPYRPEPISIQYTTKGDAVLPENVQLGIKMLVSTFYNNREIASDTKYFVLLPGASAFESMIAGYKRYIA